MGTRGIDLFAGQSNMPGLPLAARMRPRTLDEVAGQESVLGPGRLLRRAVEADRLSSVILCGPPGCGKTSIAEIIAGTTKRRFERASGATANVAVLRALLERAGMCREREGRQTILFIDEIHRFSKSQQDVLLPHVEEGAITLIGATSHNPLFFITGPLNSRSLIFELQPLSESALMSVLERALRDERGLASYRVSADEEALRHIARVSEGDGRRALNALEIAVMTTRPDRDGNVRLTRETAEESIQKKAIVYDRDEDGHYDTISAFIKSVRGSDPDAAVYWLAKMLYAGEDPRFIARRLIILASEDIGNADPRGLNLAVSAMRAVEFVGMPEARIILSQATTYLATAPKSNASYLAVSRAQEDVEQGRVQGVPEHLKNVHVNAENREKQTEYMYPHDYEGGIVNQEYAPGTGKYYEPGSQGYEEVISRRMKYRESAKNERAGSRKTGGAGSQ